MLCYVMLCDVMWCDVMWCDVMWCNVMWPRAETPGPFGSNVPFICFLYAGIRRLYAATLLYTVSSNIFVLIYAASIRHIRRLYAAILLRTLSSDILVLMYAVYTPPHFYVCSLSVTRQPQGIWASFPQNLQHHCGKWWLFRLRWMCLLWWSFCYVPAEAER